MSIRRVQDDSIEPLEIWDVLVDELPLYHWRDSPRFGLELANALEALRTGSARFEGSHLGDRSRAVEFDSLFVTGGGSLRPGLLEELRARFVCSVDESPLYPGRKGAAVLAGSKDVLGIDVGQTSIKAWRRQNAVATPRDFELLPFVDSRQPTGAQRATFVRFFREAVAALGDSASQPAPSKVVLAFSTQVAADGTPGPTTYPYPWPDARLLPDLLHACGLERADTLVLNDAELAAHSARAQCSSRQGRTLVVTVGFGVGAALLK